MNEFWGDTSEIYHLRNGVKTYRTKCKSPFLPRFNSKQFQGNP